MSDLKLNNHIIVNAIISYPGNQTDFRFELITTLLQQNISVHGTVRYGTVRYGTVRYGAVRCGTVRYATVRYVTVWYGTVRYGTVRYRTVPYDTSNVNGYLS